MADMTVVQLLEAARELISVPERWTKGAFARDKVGVSVCSWYPSATCFCLIGALERLAEQGDARCFPACLQFLLRAIGVGGTSSVAMVYRYQDHHSHAEVLELCDRAIHLARLAELAHV